MERKGLDVIALSFHQQPMTYAVLLVHAVSSTTQSGFGVAAESMDSASKPQVSEQNRHSDRAFQANDIAAYIKLGHIYSR